jgi:hypothetical protein
MMATTTMETVAHLSASSRKDSHATQALGTPSAKKFAAMDLTLVSTTAMMATLSLAMDVPQLVVSSLALTASLMRTERLFAHQSVAIRSCLAKRAAMTETTMMVMVAHLLAQ